MKNSTAGALGFAIGCLLGIFLGVRLTKERAERYISEEIAEARAHYDKKEAQRHLLNGIMVEEILKNQGYSAQEKALDTPYVISPEEFGEKEDYETISLTYYADGVLTDDNDEKMEDYEETIGKDSLDHFGEYEDDSVFVRNDKLRCDFEILSDLRTYSEVLKLKPRLPKEEQ